ncbi:MAG: 8-oxo-(d)GTP phosphatase [Actinomycetota bacterium]|jgi:8-oxo-dGTP diphosphatase
MAIHLLRHAEAGSRPSWHQPDDLRPLTSNGVVQSVNVADALAGLPITRILSSRYVRCVQTVQPLADSVGLAVESHTALAEEADVASAWALLEEVAAAGGTGDTVLCSHGNVIGALLDRMRRRGITLVADELSCRKGSVWTVNVADGDVADAVLTLAHG